MVMTLTNTSQFPPITAANFESSLHTAMLNAGFILWHTYTSFGRNRRIYREIFNNDTYGTAFYELRFNTTSPRFSVAAHVGFNNQNNTGTGTITGYSDFSPDTSNEINYVSLNGGPEFRVVLIRQADELVVVGQLRPSLKPNWWNENNYPYVWYVIDLYSPWYSLTTAGGYSRSPWDSTYAEIGNRRIIGTVPNGKREIANAVELISQGYANSGICGVFSNDIAQSATEELEPGVDVLVVSPGNEEYLVIQAATGGLVVRVV